MAKEYTFSNLTGYFFKRLLSRGQKVWCVGEKDAMKFKSPYAIRRFWMANGFINGIAEYVIYENGRQMFDLKTGKRI